MYIYIYVLTIWLPAARSSVSASPSRPPAGASAAPPCRPTDPCNMYII